MMMAGFALSTDTVNSFRKARGKRLAGQIKRLAERLGRPITVLDVGGRAEYWANVGLANIERVVVLNNVDGELTRIHGSGLFEAEHGDACALDYDDQSVDLVHSNSVIEHVGDWERMAAFANEAMRVGRAGWVQTPAFEFPVEPHWKLPFVHWFGAPIRRSLVRFAPDYGKADISARRCRVEQINLLSRAEMRTLFAGTDIHTERFFGLPKSYVAQWEFAA
jgi:hypothetical protein